MEPSSHRFAAAIVLPNTTRVALEALQAKYALPPWPDAIPLHITLVSPFTTREAAGVLAKLWMPVAMAEQPFPVTLDGLGRFDNDESVFFARVVPNQELTVLSDAALAAVSHLRENRSRLFTPHVTLADVAPRGTVDEYFRRLQGENILHTFTCDRFALLEMDETTKAWHVVQEFIFPS